MTIYNFFQVNGGGGGGEMALIMEHDDYNEDEVYESEDEEGGGGVGTNGEVNTCDICKNIFMLNLYLNVHIKNALF